MTNRMNAASAELNEHWWDRIEKALEADPESYDHIALKVMNYRKAYSFEAARSMRTRISAAKRQRVQLYLRDLDGKGESARLDLVGPTLQKVQAKAFDPRKPRVLDGVGAALGMLLEELEAYSRTVPTTIWSGDMRSLERLARLLLVQIVEAGEDV